MIGMKFVWIREGPKNESQLLLPRNAAALRGGRRFRPKLGNRKEEFCLATSDMLQSCALNLLLALYPKLIDSIFIHCSSTLSDLLFSPEDIQCCLYHIVNSMNFAASLCRRLNIKELVTNVPVYRGTADVSGDGLSLVFRRWATKKTAGSTKNGRDSKPKNLGVKKFGGERVIPGNIIVRQRGTRFHPGNYVGLGKDHTLFALKEGWVKFERNKLTGRKWVHVEPKEGHVLHPLYSDASASELKVAV
ncbi:hypothetical protein VNO77_11816 [Canavalia gladiata]|uniref:Mitochondrial ribosomal protein L27 n=1 Tax=Canavalia gladiata TaxID=3824 RepID=A0AAN9LW61_CANGL